MKEKQIINFKIMANNINKKLNINKHLEEYKTLKELYKDFSLKLNNLRLTGGGCSVIFQNHPLC